MVRSFSRENVRPPRPTLSWRNTIGKPDSFRFRVTTSRENYILELKAHLPEAAYQFAWSKVYNLESSGK